MSAETETVQTTGAPGSPPDATPSAAGSTPEKGAPPADQSAATPEQGTEQTRDEKGRFKNPVQPRIDELTRKAREEEREKAYWKARAEAAERKPEPVAEKPKVEDFDDYGDFVEALADWKADEKIKANDAKREERDAETRQASQRQTTWNQRRDDARTRIPDFDQVMSTSDVPVADHVWSLLQEADRGPEVMHAMATNPALAEKLNGMTPQRAAIEIGRIEAGLPAVSQTSDPKDTARTDEPAAPAETPPARKTSSAPPPIKPVRSGASTQVDLAKLPMDEYIEKRRQQGAKWARR